jgi:hypothetical protein
MVNNGVGVVTFNGVGIWSLWVRSVNMLQVRMSLDELFNLGIHEYQRVRLRLPLERDMVLYFRGRRERPPFVWLEFGRDARRLCTETAFASRHSIY